MITAQQIYNQYMKDQSKIMYWVKKFNGKIKLHECHSTLWRNGNGDKYLILLHQTTPNVVIFAPIRVEVGPLNSYYFFDDYEEHKGKRGILRFTDHSLRRYNSRVMKKNIFDEKQCLIHYFIHNKANLALWHNEDMTEYVIACTTGLMLCKRNPDTDICSVCTFVANDMLHEDQRKAFDAVYSALLTDETLRNGLYMHQPTTAALLDTCLDEIAEDNYRITHDILQQYRDEMINP